MLSQLLAALEELEIGFESGDDHVILKGEDGHNVGVCEFVGSWLHTQIFMGDQFNTETIRDSLLRANDRVLGFRFSIDGTGYVSCRGEVLVGTTLSPEAVRTIDSMLESVPAYWELFDRCRLEDRAVTEAELDQIASGFEQALH